MQQRIVPLSVRQLCELQSLTHRTLVNDLKIVKGIENGKPTLEYLTDSCVSLVPFDFKDEYLCYVLEIGGTHIKAQRVVLKGVQHQVSHYTRLMAETGGLRSATTPAKEFWDTVALCMVHLINQNPEDKHVTLDVAVVMGFPLDQTTVNEATIKFMSKGFDTGTAVGDPLQGCSVSCGIEEAMGRYQVKVNIRVIANDTVATIAAGDFLCGPGADCIAAAIVGTGVNECYLDNKATAMGYVGNLINTEIGQLNQGFPVSAIDKELSNLETRDGVVTLEAMSGGKYMAELCRLSILEEISHTPEAVKCRYTISSAQCSILAAGTEDEAKRVLQSAWKWYNPNEDQFKGIREICHNIFIRGAQVIGASIAGCLKRSLEGAASDRLACVCLTGSVAVNCDLFQQELQNVCQKLCPQKKLVFKSVGEAGAIGAARLAATGGRTE